MTIPRPPRLPSARRILVACAVAGIAACSYDWTIVLPASSGSDAAAPDATVEAATEAAAPADGTAAADGAIDAGTDAADAGAAACSQLQTTLETKRLAAKRCTPGPGACADYVTDECTCKAYLAEGGSPAAVAFAAALTTYGDAGCQPMGCPVPCNLSLGSCLPLDGGNTYCFP